MSEVSQLEQKLKQSGIKFDLSDEESQMFADKLQYLIEVKYKDEIGDVPSHIKRTLCQNYALQCKKNNVDIDKLMDELDISKDE
jgi:hypothetical protein